MTSALVPDWGRSTGTLSAFSQFDDNYGPLVRLNRFAGNGVNGMVVRGGTLTTQVIWDDTDIAHVLYDEIIVPNVHTYGGIRLQSSADASLVVKLLSLPADNFMTAYATTAGFTASGSPTEMTDRIGGDVQIVGTAGHAVVLTSLKDDLISAGFDPQNQPQYDTNGDGLSTGSPGDWRSIRIQQYSNDRNVSVIDETETRPAPAATPTALRPRHKPWARWLRRSPAATATSVWALRSTAPSREPTPRTRTSTASAERPDSKCGSTLPGPRSPWTRSSSLSTPTATCWPGPTTRATRPRPLVARWSGRDLRCPWAIPVGAFRTTTRRTRWTPGCAFGPPRADRTVLCSRAGRRADAPSGRRLRAFRRPDVQLSDGIPSLGSSSIAYHTVTFEFLSYGTVSYDAGSNTVFVPFSAASTAADMAQVIASAVATAAAQGGLRLNTAAADGTVELSATPAGSLGGVPGTLIGFDPGTSPLTRINPTRATNCKSACRNSMSSPAQPLPTRSFPTRPTGSKCWACRTVPR